MKNIKTNYTFNASAKTIQCGDFEQVGLARILLVVNVTRGVVIYNPSNATTTGLLSGSILTLTFDTTAHSNSDVLQIFSDDGDTGATDQALSTLLLLFSEFLERFDIFGNPAVSINSGTVTATPPNAGANNSRCPAMNDHYQQVIAENSQFPFVAT
jgi:hypothetical protein